MRQAIPALAAVTLLALAACTTTINATVTPGPAKAAGTTPAASKVAVGEISGVATAPIVAAGAGNIVASGAGNVIQGGGASIVASGAGNIVAAGAGNIVAAGAGNFVLLQAADDLRELPIVGATVFARDARTLELVPGLAPATTDQTGAFRFKGVPAGTTVLVEVVFVGKDRTAARMMALAKAEANGPKPVTVSTATTLVAVQLVKTAKAGGDQGQIELMPRASIDDMAKAMQAALTADPTAMRNAAKAMAMEVPREGTVTVDRTMPQAAMEPVGAQATEITRKDPTLQAQATVVEATLAKPLDAAQQEEVAVLKPVLLPSPTPTPAIMIDPVRVTPTPTPMPTVKGDLVISPDLIRATPTPTPTPTPAPVFSVVPIRVVSPTPTPTPQPIFSIVPIRATPTPTPTPTPFRKLPF